MSVNIFSIILFLLIFHNIIADKKPAIMTIERVEIVYCNNDILDVNVTVRKINRIDFAVSAYGEVYKDVDKIVVVNIQMYAFQSNEYRRTPLAFTRPLCSMLALEYQWFAEEITKTGHFPKNCPWPPGFYYIKNYIVDAGKVPDLPWRNMLLEVVIKFTNNTIVVKVHIYLKNNQEELKILDKFM